MIALDRDGHVAAGTSTNGMTHKVPGYVDYKEPKVCKNVFFLGSLGTRVPQNTPGYCIDCLIGKIRAL